MAIVPNVTDPKYDEEIARMKRIANGPEGKENMANEFNIDITKGGGKISPNAKKSVGDEDKEPEKPTGGKK